MLSCYSTSLWPLLVLALLCLLWHSVRPKSLRVYKLVSWYIVLVWFDWKDFSLAEIRRHEPKNKTTICRDRLDYTGTCTPNLIIILVDTSSIDTLC